MARRFRMVVIANLALVALLASTNSISPPLPTPTEDARAQVPTPKASSSPEIDQPFVIAIDDDRSLGHNLPNLADGVVLSGNLFPDARVAIHNFDTSQHAHDYQRFWISVHIRNQDVGVDVLPKNALARMGLIPPGGNATYSVTFPPVQPAQVEFEVDGSTEEAIFLTLLQLALEAGIRSANLAELWKHNWYIQADVAAVLEDFLPQLTAFPTCRNAVTDIRSGSNDFALFERDLPSCLDGPIWQTLVEATVERLVQRDWFNEILSRTGITVQELQTQIQANAAEFGAADLWATYQRFHPEVDGAMAGTVAFLCVETIPDRMPVPAPVGSDITLSDIVRRAQKAIETAHTFRFETLHFLPFEERVSGSSSGAVDITAGSRTQQSSFGSPRDIEVQYNDYVEDTVDVKLFDGSIETREGWQPDPDPVVEFLETHDDDWTLLGTERIDGRQVYVIHRVLAGQAFEGTDLWETLWIDADTFLPYKRETIVPNTPIPGPVANETSYFAFGLPVDLAVPQEAVNSLTLILPTEAEIPGGLIVTESGARTSDEITQTFPDPVDAAERFAEWGWEENAFRTFASPDGATSTSVSLHRFADAQSASEALSYLAEARQIISGFDPVAVDNMGDKSEAIVGQVAGGRELSIFVQLGDVVARLSVVTSTSDPLPIAMTTAQALLGKIEQTAPTTSSSDHRG